MKAVAFKRELLDALSDERRLPILDPVVIVVAHPDDETIGVGAQLPRFKNVSLIHVTDGSPRNLKDAIQAGFTNSLDYAAARHAELNAVLRIVGIPVCQAYELGFRDQEAALNLCEITRRLIALFQRINPRFVITHPYEGGHPDHDAVAYAVHTACAVLANPPGIMEMTSYHQSANGFVAGEFLPREDCPVNVLHLTPAEVAFKKNLLSCYRTQQATLQLFPLHEECFRNAPVYDFLSPPHTGALFYETLDFGMTGWRFRELVRAAILAETP